MLANLAEQQAVQRLAAASHGVEATFSLGSKRSARSLGPRPPTPEFKYCTKSLQMSSPRLPVVPARPSLASPRCPLLLTTPAWQRSSISVPAHFGRGAQNVLDSKYRNALALHRGDYALAGFDISSHRILQTVRDVMMPDAAWVSAHQDKLNVYTPGGFFKPHVDTPREGAAQFGTLIVCFPVAHEGGTLRVRHRGRTIDYSWGAGAAEGLVQWAAVYSDCSHEVLPVSSGARVTLTYNLVAHPKTVQEAAAAVLAQGLPTPLEVSLHEALADPEFMVSDLISRGFALEKHITLPAHSARSRRKPAARCSSPATTPIPTPTSAS